MSKLLSSNLSRLFKNKVFWLMMSAVLIVSVVSMLNYVRNVADIEAVGGWATLESTYFELVPVFGIFTAVVISLFFGTEYSDGAMRNKIIIGHTRFNVYLSAVITSTVISTLLMFAYFIGGLVGIPGVGIWKIPISQVFLYMLISILLNISLSSIFVLISMNCFNKAASAVATILLAFVLMILGSMIYNALQEPEMTSEMILTENGIETTDPHLNPNYIGGKLRIILDSLLKLLPTGQAILISNTELPHPLMCIAYSIILTVAVTVCGLLLFRKKDLK
ncbi:MAG: ABC transporter permease [Faecalibacterium sp.]|nr:ABC transporter permease [Ruminococcus sp.]MCM1391289.1 ABC transporter permease [Ruminococcus sp.]MCM1484737.1 ABC transporter permease [Faecalibacterium sp.]